MAMETTPEDVARHVAFVAQYLSNTNGSLYDGPLRDGISRQLEESTTFLVAVLGYEGFSQLAQSLSPPNDGFPPLVSGKSWAEGLQELALGLEE